MLYIYTQKGKEATKTSEFQKEIGGKASWMNLIMEATKGYGNFWSNDTLFFDSCFSGVNTVEELNSEVIGYFRNVDTNYKGSSLDTLEKSINDWPKGSYIFMDINSIVNWYRPLMDIGYK